MRLLEFLLSLAITLAVAVVLLTLIGLLEQVIRFNLAQMLAFGSLAGFLSRLAGKYIIRALL